MTRTKIEWATDTWNPVTGCAKVSEGCRHCYAERMVKRFGGRVHAGDGTGPESVEFGRVILHPETLDHPLIWRKPRRVFVCSMSDLFHEDVPDAFLLHVMLRIALSTSTFMVLTKRPERMQKFVADLKAGNYRLNDTVDWDDGDGIRVCLEFIAWVRSDCPNLWLGVSVENQATADERIPLLLETPAAVRFVSCEPMLGPVDLQDFLTRNPSSAVLSGRVTADMPAWTRIGATSLDWVICGGESGPGARPMHPDWARSLRDQCQAAGVPFFFKQWGEWAPNCLCGSKGSHRTTPRPEPGHMGCMFRCGKKAAGRELDGRTHDEFPEVRP